MCITRTRLWLGLVFNSWGWNIQKCWLLGETRKKEKWHSQPKSEWRKRGILLYHYFKITVSIWYLLFSIPGTLNRISEGSCKSQEGILNLSPHPDKSVILISLFGNRKKRNSNPPFITYQHVPDMSWKCSESQCPHLLWSNVHCTEFLWESQCVMKHIQWALRSTASVLSSINKVDNSTHFIRFCKVWLGQYKQQFKTVFGTHWRL